MAKESQSGKKVLFSLLLVSLTALLVAGCVTSGESARTWKQQIRRGDDAIQKSDWDTADTAYTAALREAEQFSPTDYRLSLTLKKLGKTKLILRKYDDAEKVCTRHMELDEKRNLTNNTYYIQDVVTLGEVKAFMKKYEEAEQLYLRAESICYFKYGQKSLLSGPIIARRAFLYTMQDRFEEAEQCYELSKSRLDGLVRGTSGISAGHSYFLIQAADMYNGYGLLKARRKSYTESEALLRYSLSILESQVGKKDPALASTLCNLAKVCAYEGKYAEAESAIDRALKLLETTGASGHPLLVDARGLRTAILARKVE